MIARRKSFDRGGLVIPQQRFKPYSDVRSLEMDVDDIVKQLKAQESTLAKFKIKSLAMFGSVARGEAKSDSDIDFLVEFDGPSTFDRYMDLKLFLEDLFGRPVDLVTQKAVRSELKPYIERELRYVA